MSNSNTNLFSFNLNFADFLFEKNQEEVITKKKKFISTDTYFIEKQEGAGCGRHALNNLLGGKVYNKEHNNITIDDNTIKTFNLSTSSPFPLNDFCKYLNTKINASGGECPDNENYDVSVLQMALTIMGYNVKHIKNNDIENQENLNKDCIGYIGGSGGHWVAFKHIIDATKNNSSQNTFKLINSTQTDSWTTNNNITLKDIFTYYENYTRNIFKVTWTGDYMFNIPSNGTDDEIQSLKFGMLKTETNNLIIKLCDENKIDKGAIDMLFIITYNTDSIKQITELKDALAEYNKLKSNTLFTLLTKEYLKEMMDNIDILIEADKLKKEEEILKKTNKASYAENLITYLQAQNV